MTGKAAIRAEAEALRERLLSAGAVPVEADLLQPAGTLLDLYGEDIRARAYVTHDPDRGEMMLRPDFTVPVVLRHMAEGAEPARYTYLGEVFRTPPPGSGRAREYLQLGYELFDRTDPAAADAEVFALFAGLLEGLPLRCVTGDIGILLAAVESLGTTERRRRALRRHIWRPRRFRVLLDRFTGRSPAPAARAALLERAAAGGASALVAAAGPEIGLRAAAEVAARIEALRQEAAAAPIHPAEAEVIDTILSLRETMPAAHARLSDMVVDMPGLGPAVARLGARLEALERAGIATADLPFEASYGRTNMEYYDGFVFGFLAEGRPDLPPVALGGRYDALTRVLGGGQAIPAVGAVVRPELTLTLRGEAAQC